MSRWVCRSKVGWFVVGSALVGVASAPSDAQLANAGIVGTVRDSAGTPLGQVVVEAKHGETGYVVRATTNESGRYSLLGVPLGGPYTLRTRAVGFKVAERGGVVLTIGARPTVDFTLLPVETRLSEVAVRADAQEGRESRVGGSTRVARRQIDALPVVDRNFGALASLSPLAGNQNALGGQRWTSTDIRIDGAQARNMLRAGEANGGPYAISLEAVREFEVNTDVFDVGQGRQGGSSSSPRLPR